MGNLNNFRIADAISGILGADPGVPTAEFGKRHRRTGQAWSPKAGRTSCTGRWFEYLRNSDLDSTDFFINKAKGTKDSAASQPILAAPSADPSRRTRTFFFSSYEEFRQVAPTPQPHSRSQCSRSVPQVTDPISQALLKFWPTANTSVGTQQFHCQRGIDHLRLHRPYQRSITTFSDKDQLSGPLRQCSGRDVFTPGALPPGGRKISQHSGEPQRVAY